MADVAKLANEQAQATTEKFIADNDERFTYTFHLDDPAVNYFTHREILSLAMKAV